MPEYLDLLRTLSIASIYILLAEVFILFLIKGKIKNHNFQLFAYVWLPLAVITQFLMTYFRLTLGKSNLPLMNLYLIIELIILVYILLNIRKEYRGIEINYKIWSVVILAGILIHLTDELNSLHSAAMLYTAIVYFNITISFIDLEKVDVLYKDPFALLNLGVFVKAFGYSYFTIYQIDYKFPLIIYSGVNLLVQIIFFLAVLSYYRQLNLTKS